MATPKQFRGRTRWSLIIGTIFAALSVGALSASGAELVTAELVAPNNDVTVTQGTTANFTISVTATGKIDSTITSGNPSTATVDTVYSLDSGGALTSGTPSSSMSFWSSGDNCGGGNCTVTWTGDPTAYTRAASVSAAATTPVGDYTITLSEAAGTTSTTDPSGVTGGHLDDGTATLVTVHVVAGATNGAPDAGAITGTTPVDEGSNHSYSDTTASDPDNDTLSYKWSVSSGNATINGSDTGTSVSLDFGDGPSTVELHLVIDDGHAHTVSPTDYSITVNNVAPTVATPTWAANPIDCTTQATLTGISWTDPVGLADQPFSGQVNWGDTTNTPFGDINALSLANQTHTYAPGTYQASVDVTDKDGDMGSSANTATLTVNQVYTVSFLQPLDASTPAKVIGNTVKKGRVVPVKAIITNGCTGNFVTDPTANVTIKVVTATFTPNATDAVETFSDAGSSSAGTTSFRWTTDSTAPGGGYWIYNLDTSGFSVGTAHNVYVKVGSTQANTNYADIVTTK
jgi:hypothetical protein